MKTSGAGVLVSQGGSSQFPFKFYFSMTRRMAVWLIVCHGLLGLSGNAAEMPRGSALFGLTNLWTLRLTISPEAWKQMGGHSGERAQTGGLFGGAIDSFFGNGNGGRPGQSRAHGGAEYPWATCTFESGGQKFTNVAIRFKGNSSFVRAPNGLKRPFRLDFNRDAPGRSFQGVEEFCLNNNVNDATQMHEALAYDLFHRAGIAAPRTAFASVILTVPGQIERQSLGLYTLVESVNRDFLKQHFDTKKGLLLKPEMMQGLDYFGDSWSGYAGRYGPKGDVNPADAKRIMEFARFIQEADPQEFGERLKEYLDPAAFTRFVALNAVLANIDSFIGNGHNYYLFLDPKSHRAQFIPWDLNEAFGAHPVSGPSRDQMTFSVLRPQADPNRLIERVIADPQFGPAYRAQCAWVLTNLFEPKRLQADIDRVASVTRRVVFAESKRAKADFERTVLGTIPPTSGDVSQPRHDREIGRDSYHPWGFPDAVEVDNIPLKDWIAGRYQNVRGQLDGQVRGKRARARLSN